MVYVTENKQFYCDSVLKGFVEYDRGAVEWIRSWSYVRRIQLK